MHKELLVKLLENHDQDFLLLTMDSSPRKRFLLLSHSTNSKIVYYINFSGGHLIFGLDERKILTSLELNIPKAYWMTTATPLPIMPSPAIRLLQFPNIESRANENELPINVFTNEGESFVSIRINNSREGNSNWISFSKQYFVDVKDNILQGFWINLR